MIKKSDKTSVFLFDMLRIRDSCLGLVFPVEESLLKISKKMKNFSQNWSEKVRKRIFKRVFEHFEGLFLNFEAKNFIQ